MTYSKIQEKLLKKLGGQVKSIREEKGMSLKDLAHKIDKDRQSIHRVEAGQINPTFLYLIEVCKGLEIDIAEIMKDLQ